MQKHTFTNSKGDMFQSDWKHWCRFQQYNLDKLNSAIRFNISENARICTINTKEDYESLPSFVITGLYKLVLDYEELAKDYDVLEITSEGLSNNYNNLYNWDIPNVLILNFDVISEQERVVIKKPFIITRLISSIMKYGKRLAHGF